MKHGIDLKQPIKYSFQAFHGKNWAKRWYAYYKMCERPKDQEVKDLKPFVISPKDINNAR